MSRKERKAIGYAVFLAAVVVVFLLLTLVFGWRTAAIITVVAVGFATLTITRFWHSLARLWRRD
ncbi:hypothetical protein [Gordonia sp. (in: high G+C Gram-positive bacteria)]|uniref:hypothetical protein n=1 Tax=Gordonia sp. (in: high G+C Gram-positive bacteria) TaxID=84139 RepID=UPI0039E7265E